MTGMEFTYAVGYVDMSLVEEHLVERDRLQRAARVRRTVRRISSVAACLVVLLAVVILARILSNDIAGGIAPGDPPPDQSGDNSSPPTDPSDWNVPGGDPGDDSSGTAFSFTFTISGASYSVTLYPDMSPTISVDSENIGELVGSVTLKDTALTCEIYTLTNDSDGLALKLPSGEYALAVRGK